jgi:hypothetical protein
MSKTIHPIIALALSALVGMAGCAGPDEQHTTIELSIEPYNVPLGEEAQRCQEMALPSDTDVDIDQIAWQFSQGSHHLHIYVSADGSTDAKEQSYDCFQAVDFEKWHLLVATQDEDLKWTLPEGVAFHLKARQSILIQTHYLNTNALKTEGSTAKGGVTLRVVEPESVEKRAAAIFAQNRNVHVPPRSSARVEADCALPSAGNIIAMTGHYHLHGRKFQTWLEPAGSTPTMVYESTGFDEPAWETYTDLHLGENDRFGWACDYDNELDIPLEFGPREDIQEHCNLFAFYTLDSGAADFLPCVIKAGEAPEMGDK